MWLHWSVVSQIVSLDCSLRSDRRRHVPHRGPPMSYLDTPRLTFAGRFFADPSTVDNNRNNFNLGVPLNQDPPGPNNNYSVGWNFQGSHVFKFDRCTVRAIDTGSGPATAGDPLIGGAVESTLDVFKYPAKLVDLDSDQQSVSQVWGLAVRVVVPD